MQTKIYMLQGMYIPSTAAETINKKVDHREQTLFT